MNLFRLRSKIKQKQMEKNLIKLTKNATHKSSKLTVVPSILAGYWD